jgi:hypothetical protein
VSRIILLLVLSTLGALVEGAEPVSLAAVSPILNPEKEGQELAAKLRDSAPAEASEISGVLEIITRTGQVRTVPLISRITVTSTNWQVSYQTTGTNPVPAETLTIVHSQGQANSYRLTTGTNATTPSLTRPFAGSDFWTLDLGLEFFHWPKQRAIRAEMRRGQPCRVLESMDPNGRPSGYSRVLSWIDNETGGVIEAEAYDSANKLLKKFALGSFKKIEGQWQLRDMRIGNVQTEQQTKLKFDLKPK